MFSSRFPRLLSVVAIVLLGLWAIALLPADVEVASERVEELGLDEDAAPPAQSTETFAMAEDQGAPAALTDPPDPPLEPLEVMPGFERVHLPDRLFIGGAMAKLGDGRILLAYVNLPGAAARPIGTVHLYCITSADQGETWSEPRLLAKGPGYNAGRPSIIRTHAGRLLVFYYGFVKLNKELVEDSQSDIWMLWSDDDGGSWSTPRRIFEGVSAGKRGGTETRSGNVLVSFSYAVPPFRGLSVTLVSSDGGETWTRSNSIDLGGHERRTHSGALEPAVVELDDRRIWMLIRKEDHFWQSFSKDGGLTWGDATRTEITTPARLGGAPADVIRLSSGRLAMAWNPKMPVPEVASPWRKIGRGDLAVALSEDEAQTWTEPVICARAGFITYPHLLEISPGEILLTTGLMRARDENTAVVMLRFPETLLLGDRP